MRVASLCLLVVLAVTGCGLPVRAPPAGEAVVAPRLEASAWVAADGVRLPVTRWRPEPEARGTVLALHGFAEHRDMFYALAPHLAAAGYEVVAYDQRGFGDTASRGRWPGRERLVADARTAWRLLREARPERPTYLLGHSMGGAVAALAVTGPNAIDPAATILLAPAVHGWETVPWLQRAALTAGAWLMPSAAPRQSWGRELADVQVTDDPRIRRVQAGDPRVLHAVRLDMLYALVDLMDAALEAASALPPTTLIQYGAQDDIIPPQAACALLDRLASAPGRGATFALYPDGYHYLARDLQRERTIGDMIHWLGAPGAALPSAPPTGPGPVRAALCEVAPAAPRPGAGVHALRGR